MRHIWLRTLRGGQRLPAVRCPAPVRKRRIGSRTCGVRNSVAPAKIVPKRSRICRKNAKFVVRMHTKHRRWMLVAGCAAALFGALCLHGYLVGERLETEGVTTKAVVTRVFSREESRPAPGYRGWRRSRKVTVYLLDYSFRVGGETYGAEVRRAGRLMTARTGDSLVVRYLPDDPSVNRPERDSAGECLLVRPRSRGPHFRRRTGGEIRPACRPDFGSRAAKPGAFRLRGRFYSRMPRMSCGVRSMRLRFCDVWPSDS